MIIGQVSARYEAVIPVEIYADDGRTVELAATVDTGFSGCLTLPSAVIEKLHLEYDRTEIYTLGDNNDVAFDVYRATLLWDGRPRNVSVLLTESEPLGGMSLLRGYSLFIDVVDGGTVRISERV